MSDESVENARGICRYELDRNHGSFVTAFLEAFLRADMDNSRILLPVFLQLKEKYRLGETESALDFSGLK